MIKFFLLVTSFVVLGLGLPMAAAEPASAPQAGEVLRIEGGYAYATARMQKHGAVFMTIRNVGERPARIIAAAADDVAAAVELHAHSMDNGVMRMREVAGYDIPAGGAVELEPMGRHIMLIGLKRPLSDGERFPLTLTTENHGALRVDVTVRSPGAS